MKIRPHGMGMLLDEAMEHMKEIPATMEAVKAYFEERGRTFSEKELASLHLEESGGDRRVGWKQSYIISFTREDTGNNWVIGFCDSPVTPLVTAIPAVRVWENMVDKKYSCYVERTTDSHKGVLKVDLDGVNLFTKDVTIAFGGPFGPDAGDVAQWEQWVIEFVDQYEKEKTDAS